MRGSHLPSHLICRLHYPSNHVHYLSLLSCVFYGHFVKGQQQYCTPSWSSRHAICQGAKQESLKSGPLKPVLGLFPRKPGASYPYPNHCTTCRYIYIHEKFQNYFEPNLIKQPREKDSFTASWRLDFNKDWLSFRGFRTKCAAFQKELPPPLMFSISSYSYWRWE